MLALHDLGRKSDLFGHEPRPERSPELLTKVFEHTSIHRCVRICWTSLDSRWVGYAT